MKKPLTARTMALLVGGELRGDGDRVVDGVAPLDRAGPRHLSFLASPRYAGELATSQAGVVLVATELGDALPQAAPAFVLVARPHEAIQELLPHLYDLSPAERVIAPTARIGRGATIGERVRIDDFAVIGDGASVGDDTHIHSSVTLYANSVIGRRCILHAGVRIGSDGFGYVQRNSAHEKIPHVGRCVIGDDVEIGANSTLDRGSIGDTTVGNGTKIDNLVHVGHNVRVGAMCLLMAQVGIAGSARIGNGVVLAGQAGIGGHVNIGDGARIAGQAGVFGDVPAGESWSGYPARPHRESLRAIAALMKLPETLRQLAREKNEA